VKIAFALLAHEHPQIVARLVRNLVSAGHMVALHYDLRSPLADYRMLVKTFEGCPAVCLARRVRVHWGEWSIVAATLNCLEQIQIAGWEPDYVFHASGSDYPIRPSTALVDFLVRHKGKEFIESLPANSVRWVRAGPQHERYQYRFYFNWRRRKALFDYSLAIQKALKLKREFVRGLEPYMGSQWWVLSWNTLQRVIDLARQRDIRRFFRTTLIPDELFFHTLVRHLVPHSHVVSRSLTLSQFTDYGVPVVYCADHVDYLLRQPFFIARKVSAHNTALHDALDACWRGERQPSPFRDADVGKTSTEYEDHRLAYRDGAPGRPLVGRPPNTWHGYLEQLTTPYFAVIGTSKAELRLIYNLLSRHPEISCHGQLFHSRRIEFAAGLTHFAGYRAEDIELRYLSAPNFLADVVRTEKHRLTGFLLRWGQGWHIPEVMFDRPNAGVVIVRGDPLISFVENALGTELLLEEPFDLAALEYVPLDALANRFRRFVTEYQQYMDWLTNLATKAAPRKPEGWILEVNLADGQALPLLPPGSGRLRSQAEASAETALLRWCGSLAQPHARLRGDLVKVPAGVNGYDLSSNLARFEERRRLAIDRLIAGGIDGIVFDALQHKSAPDLEATAVERPPQSATQQPARWARPKRPTVKKVAAPKAWRETAATALKPKEGHSANE